VSRHADALRIGDVCETRDAAQHDVDRRAHVGGTDRDELAQHAGRIGPRLSRLHREHGAHHVEDRVPDVVDRGDDVAMAREVRAEERRLPAVPAVAVRERDERTAPGTRRRVAHGVLPHRRQAGQDLEAIRGLFRDVLPAVCVRRGIPDLERQAAPRPLDARGADADRERAAGERIVRGQDVSPSGTS
jgi:hypothetical protein